jgi:PAS domain S-box-containing protein
MLPPVRKLSDSVRNALPEGRSLPDGVWRRRHLGLVILLWLHAVAVGAVAVARGYSLSHSALEAGILVLFATVASNPRLGRRLRSMACVAGLVSASAVLVHLSSGNIEMHFHFFVMVVLIGLYQDWAPFLLAIGYVVIHHGTIGVLDPGSVYNHPGALAHPWLWAGIHGAFILGESVASMIAWRLFETAHGQAQSILESAGEGIFGVDTSGNVTFANSAAASMLGMTPDEMVGREMYPLTHSVEEASSSSKDECPIYAAFRDGTARHEVDDVFTRKDGTSFPVEYTSTPIRERGRILGAVIAMRDVTAQEQLEEQLRQAQKMEAVGQLAGGVAHDFNNILGVIINNAEFLSDDMQRGEARSEDVAEIRHAAGRAAKLVGQLLSFARKEVLNPIVLNLNDAVADMEQILRRTLRESIELRFELAEDLWATELDPSQLEQVLLNLALNAGDAMPEGGKLTVQTRNVDIDEEFARLHPGLAHGRSVCLSVSDTGLGMSEEVKQRIFEPFYTTKPRGSGTGLGLATVYAIVHRVGGYVGVYSEPGLGTSFTLYFPASAGELTAAPTAESATAEGGRGETILVAEDEDALREVVERVLARNGYNVLSAGSGREVLALLQEHGGRIDLLLSDVVMPSISGPALAHWVNEMHGEVPVLFMSGYPDDVLDHMGGTRNYLQKPFTADALLAKVKESLGADVPATSG